MFSDDHSQFIESALFQTLGQKTDIHSVHFVSGGCINNTIRVETSSGPYFIKWNEGTDEDLFEKESLGLNLLQEAGAIKTPEVVGLGQTDMKNYLILEHIQKGAPSKDFWEIFGRQVAQLHRVSHEQFGLDHDNYIGRLPQKNDFRASWIDFFIENRLEVQIGLALYNNLISKDFAARFRLIYDQLPGLLPEEDPSLLHGDLWSGNFLAGPEGLPVLFDPAVYFGHREIEIAFSRLFGGFDREFYISYNQHFPIERGFEERMDIYNLYPLLVHVNLFGSSYLAGINQTLRRYC